MSEPEMVVVLHAAGLDERMAEWLEVPGKRGVSLVGQSTPSNFSLSDLATRVAGELSGPVHLVGCSLGSMVAMRMAIDHPHLVRSLVLMCAPSHAPRHLLEDRARETALRGAADMVEETLERWFGSEFLGESSAQLDYARTCLEATPTEVMAQTWRAIAGHDVRERLRELKVPTTCIEGSQDRSTPPGAVRELADGIPDSRFELLHGGHLLPLEIPEGVSEIINQHLEWTQEPGKPRTIL